VANERRKRPLKGALCVNARFWNRELRKRLNGLVAATQRRSPQDPSAACGRLS